MARPLRIEFAGAVYHIIARGVKGAVSFQIKRSEDLKKHSQLMRSHLTTFNLGCFGSSSKSIVCSNRSFLTNAAYARSVAFTDACPNKC